AGAPAGAVVLHRLDEWVEAAAEHAADAGASGAELRELAAEAGLLARALPTFATLPGCDGRTFSQAFEHFGDLVPVLVARNRQQTEKRCHRGKSAIVHGVSPGVTGA